jgi:hypothetical protein
MQFASDGLDSDGAQLGGRPAAVVASGSNYTRGAVIRYRRRRRLVIKAQRH